MEATDPRAEKIMNGDGGKNGIIAPWVRMGVDAEMAGHVRSRRTFLARGSAEVVGEK